MDFCLEGEGAPSYPRVFEGAEMFLTPDRMSEKRIEVQPMVGHMVDVSSS